MIAAATVLNCGREGFVERGKKKCRERELLKLAYWKINLPK
jgi:hypothetical protein